MAKKKNSAIEAEADPIGDFEGLPVMATTAKITNTGDGLSTSMAIDNRIIHKGQRVYVVLECDCTDVQFPSTKEDAAKLVRKQVLKAGVATIVAEELVLEVVNKQRELNQLAAEKAAGITRLPYGEGEQQTG